MSAVQTISVAVLVLVVLVFDKCLGYPPSKLRREEMPMCKTCGNFCDTCEFGVKMSTCGPVCAKGPGRACGGANNEEWGICAEGLLCHCHLCVGCTADGRQCKEAEYDRNCNQLKRTEEYRYLLLE